MKITKNKNKGIANKQIKRIILIMINNIVYKRKYQTKTDQIVWVKLLIKNYKIIINKATTKVIKIKI